MEVVILDLPLNLVAQASARGTSHHQPQPADVTWCLSPAGFEYYEASAKENINVRQVFERLVDIICVKMSERVDVELPVAPGSKATRLTDKPAQLPQKCC